MIIMTTYRRPTEAQRALKSVLAQNYENWRCHIVVDDPNSDYKALQAQARTVPKITYLHNQKNIGKNASVNNVLEILRKENFDGYVLFLDDDDWLSPTCLSDLAGLIEAHPSRGWFVINRTNPDTGLPFTRNMTGRNEIHYLRDCLVGRKFQGDATHCLEFSKTKDCRFPETIKNAEEWFYFAQVSAIYPTFLYKDTTGTFSTGYSDDGLSSRYRKQREAGQNALPLIKEFWERKMYHPFIVLYLCYRLFRKIF